MAVREVLLLGNSKLYQKSTEIEFEELKDMKTLIRDLHDTLFDFKRRYGAGRAIAAPQIGVMKRLIYMYINHPVVIMNPILTYKSDKMIQVWDDCMFFPELLVKVLRFKYCRIKYLDLKWNKISKNLKDDLSELLQHECDHLDGILAVERTIYGRSFSLRCQRKF